MSCVKDEVDVGWAGRESLKVLMVSVNVKEH